MVLVAGESRRAALSLLALGPDVMHPDVMHQWDPIHSTGYFGYSGHAVMCSGCRTYTASSNLLGSSSIASRDWVPSDGQFDQDRQQSSLWIPPSIQRVGSTAMDLHDVQFWSLFFWLCGKSWNLTEDALGISIRSKNNNH